MKKVINHLKISLDHPLCRNSVSVKKEDTQSRELRITLMNSGTVYELHNIQVAAIKGIKPDGHKIYNDCVIRDNEIIYELTNQTICVPGTVRCEVKLFGYEGEELTTAEFTIEVYDNLFDDNEIESADEYNIFGDTAAADRILADVREHMSDNARHTDPTNTEYQEIKQAAIDNAGNINHLTGRVTAIENELNGSLEIIDDINAII